MNTALKNYRDSLTQEQKDNLLVHAREARANKAALRDANKHLLKLSYLDSHHWSTLATKYKLRMPNEADKASVSVIRKCLKKLGVPIEAWNDSYTSREYFVNNNPMWSAYAIAGLCLELKEEQCA